MAHNLSEVDGKVEMFSVGIAWHGLGQVVENCLSWQEAMQQSHLDWQVVKKDLYARNPAGQVTKVPSVAMFRSDNSAYLGTVGNGYEPIQNAAQFDFVDAIIGAEQGSHYESAGALGKGEVVWVQARIPQ